jgi:hypothetical protein
MKEAMRVLVVLLLVFLLGVCTQVRAQEDGGVQAAELGAPVAEPAEAPGDVNVQAGGAGGVNQDALRPVGIAKGRYGPGDRHPVGKHAHEDDDEVIQHGGHTHTKGDTRANSGYIFKVLMGTMLGAQLLLWWWKKNYTRSFKRASLVGLWLIPCLWSVYQGPLVYYRMILVWSAYSAYTGYIMWLTTGTPMNKSAPR